MFFQFMYVYFFECFHNFEQILSYSNFFKLNWMKIFLRIIIQYCLRILQENCNLLIAFKTVCNTQVWTLLRIFRHFICKICFQAQWRLINQWPKTSRQFNKSNLVWIWKLITAKRNIFSQSRSSESVLSLYSLMYSDLRKRMWRWADDG